MIKMVAFDFDGTIVDTIPMCIEALKKYSIKNNEFYYVGDAPSDVTACREVSVTCLSEAW